MGAKQGAKVPVVVRAVSGLRRHSEGAGVKLPPLEQTRSPAAWRGRSDQETTVPAAAATPRPALPAAARPRR
jgi:hypothetical protein